MRFTGAAIAPARVVPRLQVGIDEIPRELVHDEQRPEIGELLDRVVERVEVMDDASRDDRIELVVDLAEVALPRDILHEVRTAHGDLDRDRAAHELVRRLLTRVIERLAYSLRHWL